MTMMLMATTIACKSRSRWSFCFSYCSNTRNATMILPSPIKYNPHLHKARNVLIVSSDSKRANLSAARVQRVKLPVYDETGTAIDTSNGAQSQTYHINHFLSHQSGIQALLNTNALQNFQFIDVNAYRCTLPKLALFNFEATPVLDLRVIPTKEDCTVEMVSCKFKGSKVVERQNDHFSATMINYITWDTNIPEPFLEVDVKLNISLEIYTPPFTLLPISTVEGPGNLMIQALVDRLVPLLLQQLLQDYNKWVHKQSTTFLNK